MTTSSMTESPAETPLQMTLRWQVIRQSIAVMLVVGTLLNLINQGDAIFAWTEIDWLRAALTYCVPFFVSLYGAYTANRALTR